MVLKRTTQRNSDFQALVVALDRELAIRDGEDHAFYHQFNGIEELNRVVLAYVDDKAVGCGSFKSHNDDRIEIKRMYVLPSHRRHGIAKQIVMDLEKWGKTLRYKEAVLETGKAQIEALSFYPKMAYGVIPNFYPYKEVENSICFRKFLV